jgi:hypothetical protein
MIDVPVSNEDLDANLRIGRLECPDQRRQQCVGDARRRGKPQYAGNVRLLARYDVFDRFTEFNSALGVLENFRSDVGKP